MTPGAPRPVGEGGPIGRGWLVPVVGPSGAGKDTLIAEARRRFGHRPDIVFARRVVTRPPDRTESNVGVTEASFALDRERGAFALHWRAHGLAYGVPASIDQTIRDGATVVVNVSRSVVDQARRRYANTCVVLVDAPDEVRLARLLARGREDAPAILARFARERAMTPAVKPDVVIVNDRTIETAAALLSECLDGLGAVPALAAPEG